MTSQEMTKLYASLSKDVDWTVIEPNLGEWFRPNGNRIVNQYMETGSAHGLRKATIGMAKPKS